MKPLVRFVLALLLLQTLLATPAQAGFATSGKYKPNQPLALIQQARAATESVAFVAVGGGTIEQRPIDQSLIWAGENEDGETVYLTTASRTLPRLVTGSGGSTITLVGPDTGTIVGDALTINGGSASSGRTDIDSNYQSVGEQSAIRAGDGGFQVSVKGDTTLKGGAITSTQEAIDNNKNSFETGGTLTMSDIQNTARYVADGYQVSGGVTIDTKPATQTGAEPGTAPGNQPEGEQKPPASPPITGSAGVGSDKGQADSTSKAGISGIAGDAKARTGDEETGIKPIFDKDKVRDNVNAQVQITAEFGARASKLVGDYAGEQAADLRKQADKETDPQKKEALLDEAKKWDEGGINHVILHAIVGGLTGGAGGAADAAASQAMAPEIDGLLTDLGLDGVGRDAVLALASAAVGGATGGTGGAAAAGNATVNNYLTHAEKEKRDKARSDCYTKRNSEACKTLTGLNNSQVRCWSCQKYGNHYLKSTQGMHEITLGVIF